MVAPAEITHELFFAKTKLEQSDLAALQKPFCFRGVLSKAAERSIAAFLSRACKVKGLISSGFGLGYLVLCT